MTGKRTRHNAPRKKSPRWVIAVTAPHVDRGPLRLLEQDLATNHAGVLVWADRAPVLLVDVDVANAVARELARNLDPANAGVALAVAARGEARWYGREWNPKLGVA
jgi:hypothetical protein